MSHHNLLRLVGAVAKSAWRISRWEQEDRNKRATEYKPTPPMEPCYQHFFSGKKKYVAGDYHGAIQEYENAIALKSDQWAFFFERGMAREMSGDHQGAKEDYERTKALNPIAYEGAKEEHERAKALTLR
ncbi:MAG: hypothetical protein LV481_15860 [Methylacidiphilales bacterium]|nr:hypothetical protein [Candidatus Methylacidiphilales bacterium]